MVSKKKRRRQLARAAAQRQSERRAVRAERRRRIKLVASALASVIAVSGLGYWIATHRGGPGVTPVNPLDGVLPTAYAPSDSPSGTPTTSPSAKPTASSKTSAKATPTSKEKK